MKVTDPLLGGFDWNGLNMEDVLEHSFRDYHVKGFDYLCLKRSDMATVKAYFFQNGITELSEVVNPHDHRYNFVTECVSGRVRNKWFTKVPKGLRPGKMYSTFRWNTPLNGGDGFQYSHQAMLWQDGAYTAGPGCQYPMRFNELHTIQVLKPETCIVLVQGVDRVPVGEPTRTYVSGQEAPVISDLYNTFTADQAMKRINLLKELVNVQ